MPQRLASYDLQIRGLMPPVLSVIREEPGIVHRHILDRLQAENRVSARVRMADVLEAIRRLRESGDVDGGVIAGWRAAE